jgi:hypothetical protein
MALRMTRRDTYGGERGWQDGAGVSWTSPGGGGKQQWQDREPIDPENPAYEQADKETHHDGFMHKVGVALGISRPGPKGYVRSDERVREEVCERLWHDPHVDVSEVSVEVDDGQIRLAGTVPDRRMKHRIEDIAASCAGSHEVQNRIKVVRTG